MYYLGRSKLAFRFHQLLSVGFLLFLSGLVYINQIFLEKLTQFLNCIRRNWVYIFIAVSSFVDTSGLCIHKLFCCYVPCFSESISLLAASDRNSRCTVTAGVVGRLRGLTFLCLAVK